MAWWRTGACGVLLGGLVAGGCTVESSGDDSNCEPRAERECACDDGAVGFQVCNSNGDGYDACDCDGAVDGTGGGDDGSGGSATGGSAGAGGPDGSGGAAGDGGSSGSGGMSGAGGAGLDAGGMDAADDAGIGVDGAGGSAAIDASEPMDGGSDASVLPDGAPQDGSALCSTEGLDPCNECLARQCCGEGLACNAPGDPCSTEGDAGFSQLECIDLCLLQVAGADGGVLDDTALEECSELCASDGEEDVSDATFFYAACVILECEPECY